MLHPPHWQHSPEAPDCSIHPTDLQWNHTLPLGRQREDPSFFNPILGPPGNKPWELFLPGRHLSGSPAVPAIAAGRTEGGSAHSNPAMPREVSSLHKWLT